MILHNCGRAGCDVCAHLPLIGAILDALSDSTPAPEPPQKPATRPLYFCNKCGMMGAIQFGSRGEHDCCDYLAAKVGLEQISEVCWAKYKTITEPPQKPMPCKKCGRPLGAYDANGECGVCEGRFKPNDEAASPQKPAPIVIPNIVSDTCTRSEGIPTPAPQKPAPPLDEEAMVEKVAKALSGHVPFRWDEESEQGKVRFRGYARAAIAAMRENGAKAVEKLAARVARADERIAEDCEAYNDLASRARDLRDRAEASERDRDQAKEHAKAQESRAVFAERERDENRRKLARAMSGLEILGAWLTSLETRSEDNAHRTIADMDEWLSRQESRTSDGDKAQAISSVAYWHRKVRELQRALREIEKRAGTPTRKDGETNADGAVQPPASSRDNPASSIPEELASARNATDGRAFDDLVKNRRMLAEDVRVKAGLIENMSKEIERLKRLMELRGRIALSVEAEIARTNEAVDGAASPCWTEALRGQLDAERGAWRQEIERLRRLVSCSPRCLIEPHQFEGSSDRWCELCNRPDRDPIHIPPGARRREGCRMAWENADGKVCFRDWTPEEIARGWFRPGDHP